MADDLLQKKCVPCEGWMKPFDELKAGEHAKLLTTEWELAEGKKIIKRLKFANFIKAMEFVNKVADLANKEFHHPDINISYNKVIITLTTHAIHGLSENDFIMARKIEELLK